MSGAERYGIEWNRQGLYPNYPCEVDSWEMVVGAFAPDQPDAVETFTAAHCVLGLTRIAAGREGLAVLRDWLSPRFNGHGTPEMIRRSMKWATENTHARRLAVGHLRRLLIEIRMELAGQLDAEDVRLMHEEIDILDDTPGCLPHVGDFNWLPDIAPVRSILRAVKAFCRSYPVRFADPLNTREKVAAARASIARGVP